MTRHLPGLVLAASLFAIAASLAMRDRLPERNAVLPALFEEPAQSDVRARPFEVTAGDVRYTVQPLQAYEIHGLVVSRHDTSAWWDVLHRKDWNDHLNVADLCVIWGANLRNDAYRAMRFWSEVFTCNAGTDSNAVWRQFDPDALSNNHLLTARPDLVRTLRAVRPGDQIRIRGFLAEYAHEQGRVFRRGTSLVRTDRGNGACETIWVTDARVLRTANRGWRLLMPVALAGIVLSVLLWWRLPVRPAER